MIDGLYATLVCMQGLSEAVEAAIGKVAVLMEAKLGAKIYICILCFVVDWKGGAYL